jgi:hypothetical protein
MSMYVELLSTVLGDGGDEVAGEGLLGAALQCRTRMLEARLPVAGMAQQTLAREVAYDRSLINLCLANGIDVTAARFSHPEAERARLERELATVGFDLSALAHRR